MFLLSRVTTVGLLAAAICLSQGAASAQGSDLNASVESTRATLTGLRDSFVKEAAQSGIACAIQPPKIIIHDVPSFGSYDPDTNTLTSPAWEQMPSEEQAIFYRMLPKDAKEADARIEFETGVHHWVIVHELGHWWEACKGFVDHGDHYGFEFEANKVASAYWSAHDPSVIAHQSAVFNAITKNWPNPVPSGQTAAYFNEKYESLAPTPAYLWFQAQMCLAAFEQKPQPSFAQALASAPSASGVAAGLSPR